MRFLSALIMIATALSSNCNAQDQENVDRSISHGVGLEAGGSLLFYSLFYELQFDREKHHFGFSQNNALIRGFSSSIEYGCGVKLFYSYGNQNRFRINLGYGSHINFAAIRGEFDTLEPHDQPRKYNLISHLSSGYSRVTKNNKWNFHFNLSLNYITFKKKNTSGELVNLDNWLPLGTIGIKYCFYQNQKK